jgi:hypothetical protein
LVVVSRNTTFSIGGIPNFEVLELKNSVKGRFNSVWGQENLCFCHAFPGKLFSETPIVLYKSCRLYSIYDIRIWRISSLAQKIEVTVGQSLVAQSCVALQSTGRAPVCVARARRASRSIGPHACDRTAQNNFVLFPKPVHVAIKQ